MAAREEILENVRRALGRKPGQAPAAPPSARIRIPQIALDARIELFRERLEVLGGKVYRSPNLHHAREVVQGLIGDGGAVASNSALLQAAGLNTLSGVTSGYRDEGTLRAACSTTPFGITSADYGLAETGTIVTVASSEARLVSLLPPAHIALLPSSRMLTGLDEFYSTRSLPANHASSTVFITGPSRSADIEMILVRGVHGPRIIHVIVIEEDAR